MVCECPSMLQRAMRGTSVRPLDLGPKWHVRVVWELCKHMHACGRENTCKCRSRLHWSRAQLGTSGWMRRLGWFPMQHTKGTHDRLARMILCRPSSCRPGEGEERGRLGAVTGPPGMLACLFSVQTVGGWNLHPWVGARQRWHAVCMT